MYYKTTESLLAFIKKSPTAFQATAEMEKKFTENGYQLLSEQEYWKLQPGGKYIVTRNHSALIAFSIPKNVGSFTLSQVTAILRLLRSRKIRKCG